MTPIQVVIDTNVIVSAFRSQLGASHRLVKLIGDDRWQINISTALLLEYEAVLKRESVKLGIEFSVAEDILDYMTLMAVKRSVVYKIRPGLIDPSDDFVLELAVESNAMFIITYNLKDFVGAESYGVEAIKPQSFLNLMEGVK